MTSTITDIKVQVHRPGRVSLFVDGEFWIGMLQNTMADLNVRSGERLDEARRSEIETAVHRARAVEACVHALNYRDRSEGELRTRLRQKEFSDDSVDHAIAWAQKSGYIDDRRFADQLVAMQIDKGRGRRRAITELRAKGVGISTIELAMDEHYPEDQEPEVAFQWLERRRDIKDRQKATRRLISRGFGFDAARVAVDRLFSTS